MKFRAGCLTALLALSVLFALSGGLALAATADLTWDANDETDLAGYRVYRGNATGTGCPVGPLAPLMVGGAPVVLGKVTAYKDTTVPVFDGVLCYEIDAIDSTGNFSGRSNRATKQVNLVPPKAPLNLQIPSVVP